MNEFREHRLKKERGMTPKEVIEDATQQIGKINSIVIIYEDDEGVVGCEYSVDDPSKLVGILETGKITMINSCFVEGD